MIIGRIGNNLELKKTANSSVLAMNVATDESYYTDRGDKVERTEWHRVVVYVMPEEARRRHPITWNWSCGQL